MYVCTSFVHTYTMRIAVCTYVVNIIGNGPIFLTQRTFSIKPSLHFTSSVAARLYNVFKAKKKWAVNVCLNTKKSGGILSNCFCYTKLFPLNPFWHPSIQMTPLDEMCVFAYETKCVTCEEVTNKSIVCRVCLCMISGYVQSGNRVLVHCVD